MLEYSNKGYSKTITAGSGHHEYRPRPLSVPQIVGRIPDEMKLDFIHLLNPEHHHRVSDGFKRAVESFDWLNELIMKALRAPDLYKYLDSFEKVNKKVKVEVRDGKRWAFNTKARKTKTGIRLTPLGVIDFNNNIVNDRGDVLYYDGDYVIIEEQCHGKRAG